VLLPKGPDWRQERQREHERERKIKQQQAEDQSRICPECRIPTLTFMPSENTMLVRCSRCHVLDYLPLRNGWGNIDYYGEFCDRRRLGKNITVLPTPPIWKKVPAKPFPPRLIYLQDFQEYAKVKQYLDGNPKADGKEIAGQVGLPLDRVVDLRLHIMREREQEHVCMHEEVSSMPEYSVELASRELGGRSKNQGVIAFDDVEYDHLPRTIEVEKGEHQIRFLPEDADFVRPYWRTNGGIYIISGPSEKYPFEKLRNPQYARTALMVMGNGTITAIYRKDLAKSGRGSQKHTHPPMKHSMHAMT